MSAAARRSDLIPLPFEVEPSADNRMAWMNTIFGRIGALASASVLVTF